MLRRGFGAWGVAVLEQNFTLITNPLSNLGHQLEDGGEKRTQSWKADFGETTFSVFPTSQIMLDACARTCSEELDESFQGKKSA